MVCSNFADEKNVKMLNKSNEVSKRERKETDSNPDKSDIKAYIVVSVVVGVVGGLIISLLHSFLLPLSILIALINFIILYRKKGNTGNAWYSTLLDKIKNCLHIGK